MWTTHHSRYGTVSEEDPDELCDDFLQLAVDHIARRELNLEEESIIVVRRPPYASGKPELTLPAPKLRRVVRQSGSACACEALCKRPCARGQGQDKCKPVGPSRQDTQCRQYFIVKRSNPTRNIQLALHCILH